MDFRLSALRTAVIVARLEAIEKEVTSLKEPGGPFPLVFTKIANATDDLLILHKYF